MSSKFLTAAVVAVSTIAVSSISMPSPTLQSPTIPFDLPVQASPSTTQGPDLASAVAVRDTDDVAGFISCGFNNLCTAGKQYCTSMVSKQPNGIKTTCYCPVCCAVGASCTGACPQPIMIWTIISCPASKIGQRAINTPRAEAETSGIFAGTPSTEVCVTSTWVGTKTIHLPAIPVTVTEISIWRGATTVVAPPVTLPSITSIQTVPGNCNTQTVTVTAMGTTAPITLPAITSVQTVPGSCSVQTITVTATATATASAPAPSIDTQTVVTTVYSATTIMPSASTLTVTKTVTDKITNLRTQVITSIPPANTVTATSTAISVSTNNITATMLSTLTTSDRPGISIEPIFTVHEPMSMSTANHASKSTNQATALHARAWLNPAAYARGLPLGRKRNTTSLLPSTASVNTILVIFTTTKSITATHSPSTQTNSSLAPKYITTIVTATKVDMNTTTILSTIVEVETGYHTSTTVLTKTATANQAAVHRPWNWIQGAMAYPIDMLRNITSSDDDHQMMKWQQQRALAKQGHRQQNPGQDNDPHAQYHDAAGRIGQAGHQHVHDKHQRTETKTISRQVTSTIWVYPETASGSSSSPSSSLGEGLKKRDL